MKFCKLVKAYVTAVYLRSGVHYTLYLEYRHKKSAKRITTCQPVESWEQAQEIVKEIRGLTSQKILS